MPIRAFRFEEGKMKDVSTALLNETLPGWWNRLTAADLDGDGDLDLVAGNWGNNSQMHASEQEPVELVYGDFDDNGFIDPILCYYILGQSWPMATRDDITDQIVSMRQKFPNYESYADAKITDILTAEQLKNASVLRATELHTVWLENRGGKLYKRDLPMQANYAPVYAMHVADVNKDGHPDLLLMGNIEQTRIKIGKIDANYGTVLLGDGKGNFRYVEQTDAGLSLKGCVRDLAPVAERNGKVILLAGVNNGKPVFLSYSK